MKYFPSANQTLPGALVIQLARLGDLLQSLPVISALRRDEGERPLALLCANSLAPIGALFPGVDHVWPWDGSPWRSLAERWDGRLTLLLEAAQELLPVGTRRYPVAYNLNNHPRSILVAHLLGERVVGPGDAGVLASQGPPWGEYLRLVAAHRGGNRVHLADAFCGLCGMAPPEDVPVLRPASRNLPQDIVRVFDSKAPPVGLIVGAGDADRRVPIPVWREWIETFLAHCDEGRVVLIGGPGERELAHALLEALPSLDQGRVWNTCGRVGLDQLASLLSRCRWVVGSDTGPLHLSAACGVRVMGWYFARARVHETGPYGKGHWVWQAESDGRSDYSRNIFDNATTPVTPSWWPIRESVDLLLHGKATTLREGWSLWEAHRDRLGAFFTRYGTDGHPPDQRNEVWASLAKVPAVDQAKMKELLGRDPCQQPEVISA